MTDPGTVFEDTIAHNKLTWADGGVVMAAVALLALPEAGLAPKPGGRAAAPPAPHRQPGTPLTTRPGRPGTP